MNTPLYPSCTAFQGMQRIASGTLDAVALLAKVIVDRASREPVLVFDDATGQTIEVDFRGTTQEVLARLVQRFTPAPVRGRPRLGVQSREVSLLPRHWEWLARQPGGVSVALRKLVEDARRGGEAAGQIRQAQDACYRFMSTLAGNLPGYEEAIRALFAGDPARFDDMIAGWPQDVREHALGMAQAAFAQLQQQ